MVCMNWFVAHRVKYLDEPCTVKLLCCVLHGITISEQWEMVTFTSHPSTCTVQYLLNFSVVRYKNKQKKSLKNMTTAMLSFIAKIAA